MVCTKQPRCLPPARSSRTSTQILKTRAPPPTTVPPAHPFPPPPHTDLMPPCLLEEEPQLTLGLPHPLGQAVRALAHEERDAVPALAARVGQRSRLADVVGTHTAHARHVCLGREYSHDYRRVFFHVFVSRFTSLTSLEVSCTSACIAAAHFL